MTTKKIKCLCTLYQEIKNIKDEKVSVDKISTLFQKYGDYHDCEVHACANDFPRRHRKGDEILYFLLEKLYIAKCTDVKLITAVIERIHTEGIRFCNIISDLFNESRHFATDEIISILKYCLKYTYMDKVCFSGVRMASLRQFFPIMLLPESHYNLYLPKIMVVLLQYGMFLDPVTGQAPTLYDFFEDISPTIGSYNHNYILLWCSIVNEGILKQNPKFLPVNELQGKEKEIFTLSLEIANLFLREAMQVRLSVFLLSIERLQTFTRIQNPIDFSNMYMKDLSSLAQRNLTRLTEFVFQLGRFIPGLPNRCLEPISLKFGCKVIIRKLLNVNWKLPNGIFDLDLPQPLVRYLNLEVD